MAVTKPEDGTKQGFCKLLWRKLHLWGSLLLELNSISICLSLRWAGWAGGGRLFEAGCLLNFSAFRMGAYLRWALIRGLALIRINTVSLSTNNIIVPTVLHLKFSIFVHWRRLNCKGRSRILHRRGCTTKEWHNCRTGYVNKFYSEYQSY